MAFDYAKTAATATRLLARFGQTVTVRNKSVGTYDTNEGTVTAAAPTDVSISGVMLDFPDSQKLGPGGLIAVGDRQLLLTPGVVIPGLEDQLLVGAITYVVKGIAEVNPAGTPVLYTLHLRVG